MASRRPPAKPPATPPPSGDTAPHVASPTDIADPALRLEAKKALVWVGIAALAVLVVFVAQPLLVIFGGMVFAAMIDGGARLIGRVLPIGRGWRVAMVLAGAAGFLAWLAVFAGGQIANQAAALPETVQTQAMRGAAWLQSHGAHFDINTAESLVEKALGGIGQFTRVVGGIIGGVTTLFLIVVLGIYIAAEPRLYQRGIAWLLPERERTHFHGTAAQMGRSLRMLMFGRLIGMAVEGVCTWLLLAIYGVPMAALLGLLTGLLAFLPNIGAPTSGLIMILVGFSGGTEMGLYCVAVYLVVQTVDGNVIVPMVAKKTADLAPALVLGAQLIMGTLFGILGLALADPLLAMIKVGLERQAGRNQAKGMI